MKALGYSEIYTCVGEIIGLNTPERVVQIRFIKEAFDRAF